MITSKGAQGPSAERRFTCLPIWSRPRVNEVRDDAAQVAEFYGFTVNGIEKIIRRTDQPHKS
jgi:hypothetical protein